MAPESGDRTWNYVGRWRVGASGKRLPGDSRDSDRTVYLAKWFRVGGLGTGFRASSLGLGYCRGHAMDPHI